MISFNVNGIKSCGCDLNDVREKLIEYANDNGSIHHLSLCHNNITDIPEDFFSAFPKLIVLDISYNDISSLHPNIFKYLGQLQGLNLSHNSLTSLPKDIFASLYSLEVLQLSYNKISSLPRNVLLPVKNIRYLSLRCNLLCIPEWFEMDDIEMSHIEFNDIVNNLFSTLPTMMSPIEDDEICLISHETIQRGDMYRKCSNPIPHYYNAKMWGAWRKTSNNDRCVCNDGYCVVDIIYINK